MFINEVLPIAIAKISRVNIGNAKTGGRTRCYTNVCRWALRPPVRNLIGVCSRIEKTTAATVTWYQRQFVARHQRKHSPTESRTINLSGATEA